MRLLSFPTTITHRLKLLNSRGPPILFGWYASSLTDAATFVKQLQFREGKRYRAFSMADGPKYCLPSSFADRMSPNARTRSISFCAARKRRSFRPRRSRYKVKILLRFLVHLNRYWPQSLLTDSLYDGFSSALVGPEDDRLRRFLQGLITSTGRGWKRRRGLEGSWPLVLVALGISVLFLIHGNTATLNWLSPILMRRLRGIVCIFSFLFRRRGAW